MPQRCERSDHIGWESLSSDQIVPYANRREAPRIYRRFECVLRDDRLEVHQGHTANISRCGAAVLLPIAADIQAGDKVTLLVHWANDRGHGDACTISRDAEVKRVQMHLESAPDGSDEADDLLAVALSWEQPLDLSNFV